MAGSSFEAMVALVDRRERAAKQVKPCPSCGTVQVQLTSWFGRFAQWRCRHCGEVWEGEKPLDLEG